MKKRDYQLRATPCCGTKPLIYMRPTPHQFCCRCDRQYDAATEEQQDNFMWKRQPDGTFACAHPESDAAKMPGRAT